MSETKSKFTEAELAIGLAISVALVLSASLALHQYGMAESFVDDQSACQAKNVARLFSLMLIGGIVGVIAISYYMGYGRLMHGDLTKSSNLNLVKSLVVGSTATGMVMALAVAVVAGLSIYGIYNNVSEWKSAAVACGEDGSAMSDPATIAKNINTMNQIMFLVAISVIVVYVAYLATVAHKKRRGDFAAAGYPSYGSVLY